MDSLLAPGADGNYHTYFGKAEQGLFVHRVEEGRYLFRHQGSGHSLFFFLGESESAHRLLASISGKYDFCRDSTWVFKGLSEIHALLLLEGLTRAWLHRSWHYFYRACP